jgi:hypothetical protein
VKERRKGKSWRRGWRCCRMQRRRRRRRRRRTREVRSVLRAARSGPGFKAKGFGFGFRV